jgi:ribonuclease HI
MFRILLSKVETLDPIRRSNMTIPNAYQTHTTPNKQQAIKEQKELEDTIQIFTDGSGHNRRIGAAVVLIREGQEPCTLKYHLGPDKTHMVYEVEVVSLTLAAKLLAVERNIQYPATILVDNQAAILSSESHNTKPGGYLVEHFRSMTRYLANNRRDQERNFKLTVRWIPGHEGVISNELADVAAKEAAEGPNQNSAPEMLPKYLRGKPLPDSISALKQWHEDTLRKRWEKKWKKSPRHARATNIDPTMPSNRYIKLVATLPRRQTSLYTQLRTRHLLLNQHLHHIGKSATPHCPACPDTDETIHHFLFNCPQYIRECHHFTNALRRQASSIQYILTAKKATQPLKRYINQTKRFKPIFGELMDS